MSTRVIICGGRDFSDKDLCFRTLDEILPGCADVEIVSGHAKGGGLLRRGVCRSTPASGKNIQSGLEAVRKSSRSDSKQSNACLCLRVDSAYHRLLEWRKQGHQEHD